MNDIAGRATALGIETEYVDALGHGRRPAEDALRRLADAIERGGAHTALPRSLVWRAGQSETLTVDDFPGAFEWSLASGKSIVAQGAADAGRLNLPTDTPHGIYRLALSDEERSAELTLIAAPPFAYQLDAAAERMWLLSVQLYAVRSRRNWGHGDFTDLKHLVTLAGEAGAAGIGLNPLHALFDDRPEQASPYAPNSRLFLNPLYIDPDAIPEFPGVTAGGLAIDLDGLRAGDFVDYATVGEAKAKALRLAYAAFRDRASAKRRAELRKFCRARGEALTRFAAFEVLRGRFRTVWWDWPQEWRVPTKKALTALRREAAEEMGYYEFVQWEADRQLAACSAEAERLGLPVGLYIDLAVGVEPGGADAWSDQASIIPQVEVGAPPDILNTAGQAWGVAAFNPHGLVQTAFAPLCDLLAAAMRHAGAIRLDHVLGLNRLFLIPFGSTAQDGAYLRYPLQALLGVIALMSVQHRCVVIGEDLGTVPDELRGILADWGVWSYLVMMFERRAGGAFKLPEEYRRNALATFGTHDLAAYAGWNTGYDLAVKRGVGLDPGETDAERVQARWMLGEALARADVCRDRAATFPDIVRFLARSPSRAVAVGIEDVLGLLDQPNIPGTTDQHPNWQRRLTVALEDFAAHDGFRAVAAVLVEEGRALREVQ